MFDLRVQIGLVRALLDELELVIPGAREDAHLRGQVVEEMFRLSSQVLEAAGRLVPQPDDAHPSG